MKNAIKKYLKTKKFCNYNILDKLFDLYVSGEMKCLLSVYDDVDIYPKLSNRDNTIQITYSYNNIHVGIDFFENNYDVVIYHTGIKPNELEKKFIKYYYDEGFDFKFLIESIDEKIKTYPELKDISKLIKKRKNCFLVSRICFLIPVIIISIIALYVAITKETIYLGPQFLLVIIIPLCIWFIFNSIGKHLE